MSHLRIFLFLLLCLPAPAAQAQLTTRIVKDSLFIPWELVHAPDGRIWFTQKNGYICRVTPATGLTDTVYHETASVIQGEGGMMGMAIHPQFPVSPYVYVAHNYSSGGYKVRVVRYTYNGTDALGSPLVLLPDIAGSTNHNGCRLTIVGDKLFITTGDAENLTLPQNVASRNGKVLRINLDGSVPADNPNPASPVWSWGHRNAQGLTYHNGILYSSEHGPSSDDEINIIRKGRNYGWPIVAGICNTPAEQTFCNDSGVVEPIRTWTPTIAVSGMIHYHHPMFPQFQGSLLLNTLKDQKLYKLELAPGDTTLGIVSAVSGVAYGRLRGITVSPQGRIYVSTSNSPASGTGAKIDRIVEIYDPSWTPSGIIDPSSALRIYPNPASDVLQVDVPDGVAYSILGIDGRTYASGRVSAGKVFCKDIPPGLCMLRIEGYGKMRFVKAEN